MRRRELAALVGVLVLALIALAALSPHRCFLDVLNAQIAKGCTFERFYAGVPGRPSTRGLIPELGDLEDDFPAVQAEALEVFAQHLAARERGEDGVPRMDRAYNEIFGAAERRGPLAGAARRLEGWAARLVYGKDVDLFDRIGSDGWRTFNLLLYGQEVPGNAQRCPALVGHLRRIPGLQSALISIIAPGTYIPPHNDPAKGVIRYHLAFKVPQDRENCFIEVDGERYCWTEGAGVVFDDVFDHWVSNATDEYRVILFADLLRPLRGSARALQSLANAANRVQPGVRRLIRASRAELPPAAEKEDGAAAERDGPGPRRGALRD